MKGVRFIGATAIALFAVLSPTSLHAEGAASRRASLMTVEGTVASVATIPGEGGHDLDVLRLRTDEAEPRELTVMLAPASTLRQIDFEVRAGDRVRARIFLSEDAFVLTHKVMNITRGTMVRLRTLTGIPLWDGNGRWQGGPCRSSRGGPGPRGPRR